MDTPGLWAGKGPPPRVLMLIASIYTLQCVSMAGAAVLLLIGIVAVTPLIGLVGFIHLSIGLSLFGARRGILSKEPSALHLLWSILGFLALGLPILGLGWSRFTYIDHWTGLVPALASTLASCLCVRLIFVSSRRDVRDWVQPMALDYDEDNLL